MEILTQTQRDEISRVLKIKKLHSEVEEEEDEDDEYLKEFKCFKIVWEEGVDPPDSYINHLFPVFYYEWSQRQKNDNRYTSKLFLSICIRIYSSYRELRCCSIDNSNNTIFKQQFKELDKVFKKYRFNDADIYFLSHRYIESEWRNNTTYIERIDKHLKVRMEFYCDHLTFSELRKQYHNCVLRCYDLSETNHILDDRCHELFEENRNLKNNIITEPTTNTVNELLTFKDEECVICFQNKPNILFCNCGHLCICEECEKMTSTSKCPKCRFKNSIKRKIF